MEFKTFWLKYKNNVKKKSKKEVELFNDIEKNLGEWALGELKKELAFSLSLLDRDVINFKRKLQLLEILCKQRKTLFEIAATCLGEENVYRKLIEGS